MDLWHPLIKFADHYRYTLAAVVLVASSMIWIGACASKTGSLVESGKSVSREELSREVIEADRSLASERARIEADLTAFNAKIEAHNATIDVAMADLDRQDALRASILKTVGGAAIALVSGGGVDPVGLVATGIGLAGAALAPALIADARRKDKRIKALVGVVGDTA